MCLLPIYVKVYFKKILRKDRDLFFTIHLLLLLLFYISNKYL